MKSQEELQKLLEALPDDEHWDAIKMHNSALEEMFTKFALEHLGYANAKEIKSKAYANAVEVGGKDYAEDQEDYFLIYNLLLTDIEDLEED